jgi:protein arginine N-methyltransferase 1
MYELIAYAKILADTVRVRAYADAIRETVGPGAIVVDLGTGPGIFALLACTAGASHVYAIEQDPIVGVARALARANGYGDRITFIEASSRAVDLPQRADVMVADVRGMLPLYLDAIVTLADARDRFLRPGGSIVPARDVLHAAIVEAPLTWRTGVEAWDSGALSLDLTPARDLATHALWRMAAGDGRLLTVPQRWIELDYATIRQPHASGALDWEIAERGTAHGLMLWFDAQLSRGASFSTGPEGASTVYGRAMLPFEAPVACERGDRVHVDLRADYVTDGYVWTWTSTILRAGAAAVTFRQCTLGSSLLSTAQLPDRSGRA